MKFQLFLVMAVIVFVAAGCWRAEGPGAKEFLEIEKLHDDQAKLKRFNEYPIDTQIDTFMFAARATEGSGGNYQRYLAYDGANKIERISERIVQSTDWYYKMHLIYAVIPIQSECGCVRSNTEVMKNLRTLNGLDDGTELNHKIRDAYIQFLRDIEGQS